MEGTKMEYKSRGQTYIKRNSIMFNESSQYECKIIEKCTRDDLRVEDIIKG
jgi:hypothetical protein